MGSKGHKVVAALSLEYLSDVARAGVQSLLGPDDSNYINAPVWADQIRDDRPQTKPWHFVDIPNNAPGYDPARDCKNQNCAVARIDLFAKQLADRKAAKAKRVEALKFVIHFVGDIHQPLHGAEDDNDQGGNLVFVTVDGITDKLHSVWDTQLVNKLGSTPEEIAENLESRISEADVKKFSRGTPKDWAEESHKIAHDFIYAQSKGKEHDEDNPVVLPNDYLVRHCRSCARGSRSVRSASRWCSTRRSRSRRQRQRQRGSRQTLISRHIFPWNFFSAFSTKLLSNVSSTLMLAAFTSGRNAASTSSRSARPPG